MYRVLIRGGTNSRPDPDPSSNRCAKPDVRYPTRLSAKVLTSRITVHSILTVTFSSWVQSPWCHRVAKIAARSNDLLNSAKLEILRMLSNPHWVNPTRTQSWSQLTYPIPDPIQIFFVRTTPSTVNQSKSFYVMTKATISALVLYWDDSLSCSVKRIITDWS